MKEKNLVNRLTGKGSNKVRRSMNSVRGPEYEHLRSQLQKHLGPRAGAFVDTKIPKAMRRAMRSKPTDMTTGEAMEIAGKQGQVMMNKFTKRLKSPTGAGHVQLPRGDK